MKDNVVLLYSKLPRIGNSKTRIAKESNDIFAWLVSMDLLKDTINKTSSSKEYDFVVITNGDSESKIFEDKFKVKTYALPERLLIGNQSERFSYLFNHFKKQYNRVVLIPNDVPNLTEKDILESFNKLESNNYVFGPENNGGVYLIGMSTNPNNLFENVRWSTITTVRDLINNSLGNGFSLKLKDDVNTLRDLIDLKEEISNNSPLLYKSLEKLGFYKTNKNKWRIFEHAHC